MITKSEKAKQTIKLFGVDIAKYTDCDTCHKELACEFIDNVGYYQPCKDCRKKPEYREHLNELHQEKKKLDRIDNAQKAKLPVAVHEYKGQYLYTNHRGDIIKDEKVRPMARGEKYKK